MNNRYPRLRQRGMMLLEVMIGIVIFAIGVLGMVKMRAVATANSVNLEDRTTAALLANDLIAELWVAKSVSQPPDYAAWQGRVTATWPTGTGTLSANDPTNPNLATITITWPRKLGRNADFGDTTGDSNSTATYTTQVVIQ